MKFKFSVPKQSVAGTQPCSFAHVCPWPLSPAMAEWGGCGKDQVTCNARANILTIWPFAKRFIDLRAKL